MTGARYGRQALPVSITASAVTASPVTFRWQIPAALPGRPKMSNGVHGTRTLDQMQWQIDRLSEEILQLHKLTHKLR